jgi:hypothetical protein
MQTISKVSKHYFILFSRGKFYEDKEKHKYVDEAAL